MAKNFLIIAFVAVLCTLISYVAFHVGERTSGEFHEKRYKKSVDSLERENKNLEGSFFFLNLEHAYVRHRIDSLEKRDSVYKVAIAEGERKLKIIREKYNHLEHIDRMNSVDIKNYFDSAFSDQ